MRGRCFEVTGNRWKSREALPEDLVFTADLLGMDGDSVVMRELGWSFLLETNHFTGKKRILANHSAGWAASGELASGHVMFLNLCNTRYGRKMNAEWVRNAKAEPIELEELEPSVLLDVLSRIYQPVRKKVRKVVDIEKYIKRKKAA